MAVKTAEQLADDLAATLDVLVVEAMVSPTADKWESYTAAFVVACWAAQWDNARAAY